MEKKCDTVISPIIVRQNNSAVVKDFCFIFGTLLVRFSARNYLLWNFPQTLPTNDSSIAHSIICTWLFHGKMHSDWFNGIAILQGRWQHGEKVGYCYPNGSEKTLCKWDIHRVSQVEGTKLRESVPYVKI